MLHDEGGQGAPIVLLHGLMGRGRTWRRHLHFFREFGRVYTFDAAGHGRPPPPTLSTDAFVDDLDSALAVLSEPITVVGHSMGALHGWCYAARHPERVRRIVVEDMAPDFRGRTAEDWSAMIHGWPQPFGTADAVREYFGPVAGEYFLDSFDEHPDGYRLHGDVDTFTAISQEWGRRDFWQEWSRVRAPALLIEGEHTITPAGQMRRMAEMVPDAEYVRVHDAAHLVHDEQPRRYREAVRRFFDRDGS